MQKRKKWCKIYHRLYQTRDRVLKIRDTKERVEYGRENQTNQGKT